MLKQLTRIGCGDKSRKLAMTLPAMTLVEVLGGLALCGGLMLAFNTAMVSINNGVKTSIDRAIENAFVNSLYAKINFAALAVETLYDVSTKTQVTLPGNKKVWYTKNISSAASTADKKEVDIYLFRDSAATTPYRQFHWEYTPKWRGYYFGRTVGITVRNYFADHEGRIWTNLSSTSAAGTYKTADVTTRKAGIIGTTTGTDSYSYNYTMSGVPAFDFPLYQGFLYINAGSSLEMVFPATLGQVYTITLGHSDFYYAGNTMSIYINDSLVGSMPQAACGATCPVTTYAYTATPMSYSGMGAFKLKFVSNGSGWTNMDTVEIRQVD